MSFRLSDDDIAKMDELKPVNASRSDFLRMLIRQANPMSSAASADEAMELLSESARAGSVPARVALARLLMKPSNVKKEDDVSDAINRILAS